MPKPILIKKIEPASITVSMLLDLHNASKTCERRYRNTFALAEQDITRHQKKERILLPAACCLLPAARCAKREALCAVGFIAFLCTIGYGKHAF